MKKTFIVFNPDSLKWEVRATVKGKLITVKSFPEKKEAENFKELLLLRK